MAAGDYVATYKGAVDKGAASVVLQALAGGISPTQALEARFASLPHEVAVNLARQLSRGPAAQQVRGGRALAEQAAVPATGTIVRVPGLPVPARYTVAVVFEDEQGLQQKIVHHIDNLPADATWDQIQAEAARQETAWLQTAPSDSPSAIAAREEMDIAQLPPPVLLRAEFNTNV